MHVRKKWWSKRERTKKSLANKKERESVQKMGDWMMVAFWGRQEVVSKRHPKIVLPFDWDGSGTDGTQVLKWQWFTLHSTCRLPVARWKAPFSRRRQPGAKSFSSGETAPRASKLVCARRQITGHLFEKVSIASASTASEPKAWTAAGRQLYIYSSKTWRTYTETCLEHFHENVMLIGWVSEFDFYVTIK